MEDLLQERLELLESGESLAVCVADLPNELAEILQFAAAMREVEIPVQTEQAILTRRDELLQLAAVSLTAQNSQVRLTTMDKIRQWMQNRSGFDWMMAAVLGPSFVILLIAIFANFFTAPNTVVVEESAPVSVEEVGTESNTAAPPVEEDSEGDTPAVEPPAVVEDEPDEVVAEASPSYNVFLPHNSNDIQITASTAALEDVRGLVEVQQGDGTWVQVAGGAALQMGARVRTAAFSSATLAFYDGSKAYLQPATELSIDELNAQRPEEGFRTIVMTQWQGESEHHVAFRNDGGSRYEVKNPSGTGLARGTVFTVTVIPNVISRYTVLEGRVDVTNVNVTVIVVAGQLTIIPVGQAPKEPAFHVSGEGEVTQTGSEWIIGGQTFKTDENTVIIGDPQVGDFVSVEGHLAEDGSRIADRIVLLRRELGERFTMTGEVETIAADSWTVAGQELIIEADTVIGEDIAEGDTIQVSGRIEEGGVLVAEVITLVEEEPGLPFSFVGIVQLIGEETWTISGQVVYINEETAIDEDLAVGDTVQVTGWITSEGEWLAGSIERYLENEAQFSFTGTVQSIDPWVVSGIGFETRPWTIIGVDIEVDSEVRVTGIIAEDGTWIATNIELLEEERNLIILIGIVESIDPWIVNGLPFEVDEDTVIGEGIEVGTRVQVIIEILPDGTWLALSIQPLEEGVVVGCFTINSTVVSINGGQLVLENWPTLTISGVNVMGGDLTENAVIVVTICVNANGVIIVTGPITVITVVIVIYNPPAAPPTNGGGNNGGGNTTLCHRPPGNPQNSKTITVGPGAVQAHLGHGDTMGPCN